MTQGVSLLDKKPYRECKCVPGTPPCYNCIFEQDQAPSISVSSSTHGPCCYSHVRLPSLSNLEDPPGSTQLDEDSSPYTFQADLEVSRASLLGRVAVAEAFLADGRQTRPVGLAEDDEAVDVMSSLHTHFSRNKSYTKLASKARGGSRRGLPLSRRCDDLLLTAVNSNVSSHQLAGPEPRETSSLPCQLLVPE
ncbi:uncharacterized protein [Panulirus ornatus]|uniref:uncharacterized protein n=1 Tax=Panulirus ornatus TaxID=150431 RepID=UPI003A89052C